MIINRFNRFLCTEASPAGDTGGGSTPPAGAPPAAPSGDPAPGTPPPAEPQPGDPQPPIPPANQRPEWFPEKYWKDGGPADVETLGKSYTELQKAFSAKNPHLAEVPENPEGYAFKPEKLPDGVVWSDDAAKHFAPIFHAAQIGNGQAKAIAQGLVEFEAANLAAATKTYEEMLAKGQKDLSAKWGGDEAYAAKRDGIAAFVADKLGEDPENDATLFANPRNVEFLGKVVDYVQALESQLGEDALSKAKGAIAPGNTFTSGATEANRIMSDPTHPQHDAYLKGDVEVQKKVLQLLGAQS